MFNLATRYAFALAISLSTISIHGAEAQTFPQKPVRLVVGFAVGGGTDTIARVIGRKLAEVWPQTTVIENRPGADGAIATELVAKSAADGYTLVMVSNAHTITPFLRNLAYDPVKDFVPITLAASTPNLLLVHPTLPARNVKELVTLAKARPGQLTFGSSGAGTSPFLAMELFKSMTGTNIEHIPYKGSSPAVIDLIGGHIQLMFGAVPTLGPSVRAGKLRAIAVSSPKPWPTFPDVPTVASTLPGFEAATWYGVLAPAGTPPATVTKLQNDIAGILHQADVRKIVTDNGFEAMGNKSDEFAQIIQLDLQKWGKLIRSIGTIAGAQ